MDINRYHFNLAPDSSTYIIPLNTPLNPPGAAIFLQNFDSISRSVSLDTSNSPAGPWTAVGGATSTVVPFGTSLFTIAAQPLSNYLRIGLSGGVGNVDVVYGGVSYTSAPTVVFTGSGTGAAATAVLDATSSVTGVTSLVGGTGYTTPPTVTIAPPPSGTQATATATVSGGAVTAINIVVEGNGYTSVPAISITGGGGSGASATAVLSTAAGPVVSVTVTAAGTGYLEAPSVSFTGGGGSGASATAYLTVSSPSTLGDGVDVQFLKAFNR